jgi:hypothetical protein
MTLFRVQATRREYAPLIKCLRYKVRGALLATLIVVCAACALAPAAALAGTLDQQQTDFSVGTGTIDSSETSAQTFTAGLSGGIDQVDLYLETSGSPTTPLNVEIRDVSGGAPVTTVLAGQSIPVSSVPAAGSWVTVNFATSAPVTAGGQYAIVAYSSPVSVTQHYFWGYGGNSYAGGGFAYTNTSPPSGPWTSTTTDLAFKTYVAQPKAATGERAAALKKCKHKHSKKKRRKCRKRSNRLPL